jgi:hypothetical protein
MTGSWGDPVDRRSEADQKGLDFDVVLEDHQS